MAGIGCFPLICLTNYQYAIDVTSEKSFFELLSLYTVCLSLLAWSFLQEFSSIIVGTVFLLWGILIH